MGGISPSPLFHYNNYHEIRLYQHTYRFKRIHDIQNVADDRHPHYDGNRRKKEPDESKACIAAMAYSVALAIVGSRSIFHRLRAWLLCRRFMKRSTFAELFDCYQKTLLMIPLEDIASVAAVMEGLATTISKDHD